MLFPLLLFFFSRTEGYRKVPYHYYEQGRDECDEYFLHEHAPYGGHRFITEKKVFAKWAKTHRIIFTHPNWTVSWCWFPWYCHYTWHDHDIATVMLMRVMWMMLMVEQWCSSSYTFSEMVGKFSSNLVWDLVEGDCAHHVVSEGSTRHTALYNLTGIHVKASNMATVTWEMGRLPFKVAIQKS